jgi:hypothetical protein
MDCSAVSGLRCKYYELLVWCGGFSMRYCVVV